MTTILVIDDEDAFRDRLALAFERRGMRAFKANGYDQALELIRSEQPELAVCDLKMPGKNGLMLVRDALELHPHLRIVILTGYGSIATAIDAVKLGAVSYLSKPADADEILQAFTRTPDLDAGLTTESLPPPSLARTEWEHINRILTECAGNVSETARRLGIHRRTLQRKLQKFPPSA